MWNEPRGYGKLYANIKSKQNCTWSLLPPSNRTKVILVLKAVHFQKVNRSQTYMQRVILPDGSKYYIAVLPRTFQIENQIY